ncbi:hypothetical protein V8B55DRAFT_1560027 [Mucor lusitanicus]
MYFSLDCLFAMSLRFHEYLENAWLFSLILSVVYSWRSFSTAHLAVYSKANASGVLHGVSNALLSIPHGFFPASTILCRHLYQAMHYFYVALLGTWILIASRTRK